MIEFSSSFKLDEIHKVDRPFKEDPKDIHFFRGGTVGKFREKGHLLLCKSGVVNFKREYQPLSPGSKILVMPQFFYMPDQILGQKGQNLTFL